MKFLFAFLTLLHFHQLQVQSHANAVSNIITRLNSLNDISTNSTSSEIEVPSSRMQRDAECCVWKFEEITMEALRSVTVSSGSDCLGVEGDAPVNRCIEEIKTDLKELPARQVPKKCSEKKKECTTKRVKTEELKMGLFREHIKYLQKLNRKIRFL